MGNYYFEIDYNDITSIDNVEKMNKKLSKKYYPVKTVDDELNEKAKTYIGKECNVSSIEDGVIKVQIGKSLWFAKGSELSVGQAVKIVGVDSSTFIVEPVKTQLEV